MSFYLPPWENGLEPNAQNVRQFLDNLYSKFQPVEQARWNQANIDSLFYAGEQTFINRYFNFTPSFSWQNFHFNILQQPVNLVTGYQRQHRKSITYVPTEGADSKTTDQYTRLMMHACNESGILEAYSKACEQSAISGMVLAQPYLDYQSDPAQGDIKLKVWSFNSFLIDPYFREPDMSDAQFVWCQQYMSKQEAENLFPDKKEIIRPMAGTPQRYGRFYFLPENYNMARNDLMVVSYVWYKSTRKRKKLYNPRNQQVLDFGGSEQELHQLMENMPGSFEIIEVEVPTWKLAVVLNDQLMFQGENPLGFDSCPFVPIYWNYDPHLSYYDLRVRSLVRSLRDPQFLLNRRIILNHDISESSVNTGFYRVEGAVVNEENLRKGGQGYDIILTDDGRPMADKIAKIIPNQVPPSDMQLADQLMNLIYSVSGVNLENWSAQDQKQVSGLTVMLKQAANLMVLQKFFDQWDHSLKILAERLLQVVLNNWNAAKVSMMIGEEPTPFFFTKVFAKYKVLVAEGLNTATQQNMHAAQLLEINQMFGREVIPASLIIKDMNLSGKDEIMKFIQGQEQQMAAVQEHSTTVQHAIEEAKLKELYSKAASNIAMARERHGRAESNIGLFEERLSEISQNRALATKAKVESLEKLLNVISKYGEIDAAMRAANLAQVDQQAIAQEDVEKTDAKRTSLANDFVASVLNQVQSQQAQEQEYGT